MTIFWWNLYCGFSGQLFYEEWTQICFNVFFTSLPVFALGFFEVDTRLARLCPSLYTSGQLSERLNTKVVPCSYRTTVSTLGVGVPAVGPGRAVLLGCVLLWLDLHGWFHSHLRVAWAHAWTMGHIDYALHHHNRDSNLAHLVGNFKLHCELPLAATRHSCH